MTMLPAQLRDIGIELVVNDATFLCDCPFHTGTSQTNTVIVRQDKDGWFYKCFACGAKGRDVGEWLATELEDE